MIVLFMFYTISVSIISIEFSNFLISEMSLKTYQERNNCLKDLIHNGIGLMMPVFFKEKFGRKNTMMNLIVNETIRDNNLLPGIIFISKIIGWKGCQKAQMLSIYLKLPSK